MWVESVFNILCHVQFVCDAAWFHNHRYDSITVNWCNCQTEIPLKLNQLFLYNKFHRNPIMRGWSQDACKTTKHGSAAAILQLTGFCFLFLQLLLSLKTSEFLLHVKWKKKKRESVHMAVMEDAHLFWLSLVPVYVLLRMHVWMHACRKTCKRCRCNRSAPRKNTHTTKTEASIPIREGP